MGKLLYIIPYTLMRFLGFIANIANKKVYTFATFHDHCPPSDSTFFPKHYILNHFQRKTKKHLPNLKWEATKVFYCLKVLFSFISSHILKIAKCLNLLLVEECRMSRFWVIVWMKIRKRQIFSIFFSQDK